MEWSMCVEMLFRNTEATTLGLVVRWLCQRPRVQHGEHHEEEPKDEL